MEMKTADRVVLGHRLTNAHIEFLLSLPADGTWRRTQSYEFDRHEPNSFRGFGQSGLIDGYYQEEMRHRLTRAGREVVAYLRAHPNKDEAGR